ncbi:MAG: hypothetical protein Q8N53_19485 [Longimicrobiales bacterium]|nr:hypothetical protein [Longimicrobiales bacterium]
MKRTIGLFVGVILILFAFGAYKTGMVGWAAGQADLGVWWTVVGIFLTLAGLGALLGTWIHAWADDHAH